MNTEEIAKAGHEINRALCVALGDESQLPWEIAPEWQKESARNGVEFHKNDPNAGPHGSHVNWLLEKEEAGWKYGPVKDVAKKEHPCMVPFTELPKEQQLKDVLFTAVVEYLR